MLFYFPLLAVHLASCIYQRYHQHIYRAVTFPFDIYLIFLLPEYTLNTKDFLLTQLQLLLVKAPSNRFSTCILDSIRWWFSSFHTANGKQLFCLVGCRLFLKRTFLSFYTYFITHMEFRWCSFSSINFSVKSIVSMLIACWIPCI